MPFSFDPRNDRDRIGRFLIPPVEGYPYFEGATAFAARTSDYSPVNAALLAEISLLAYAAPRFIEKLFNGPGATSPLPGFRYHPIRDDEDTGCFLLVNDSCVIVAFRGTRVPGLQDVQSFEESLSLSLQDVVIDARFPPADFKDGRVHGGMLEVYEMMAPDVASTLQAQTQKDNRAVWFTGHSLGGALATLAAADYGDFQGLYTFGSPRVGDAAFLANLSGKPCYRHVHHDDFVARLPPPFSLPPLPLMEFTHIGAGKLVYIDRDGGVDPDTNPDSLTDPLAGAINWRDLFLSFLAELGTIGDLFPHGPIRNLLDVPIPPGALVDHAPIYYATFLRKVLDGGA